MADYIIRDSYPVQTAAYESAGDASARIKRKLKQLGVDSKVLRRVSVASYEVELNLVIHSDGGELIIAAPEELAQMQALARTLTLPAILHIMEVILKLHS